jgi:hypothetical protein
MYLVVHVHFRSEFNVSFNCLKSKYSDKQIVGIYTHLGTFKNPNDVNLPSTNLFDNFVSLSIKLYFEMLSNFLQ